MRKIFVVLSLCACAGVGTWIYAQAQDTSEVEKIGSAEESVRAIVEGDDAVSEEPAVNLAAEPVQEEAQEAVQQEMKYSLGVMIGPLPPMVSAQLPEAYAGGVFLNYVHPKSAADKAGIKPFDIIVAINGDDKISAEQLQKTVANSDGKEITLTIVRSGEKRDVKVTPEPKSYRPFNSYQPPMQDDSPMTPPGMPAFDQNDQFQQLFQQQNQMMEQMQRRIEQIERSFPGFSGQVMPPQQQPQFHRNFHFGPRLGFGGAAPQPQPGIDPNQGQTNSFSISVEKYNDQPAKYKINDNGNVYEATEDDLDKLPEDVRKKINIRGSFQINPAPAPAPAAVPADDTQTYNDENIGVLVNLR